MRHHFLKKQGREINIQTGKEIFEKYLKKQKVSKDELTKEKYVEYMLKSFSFKTIEDCYENIGFGSVSPFKVMNKLNEAYKKENRDIVKEVQSRANNAKRKTNSDLVIVDGISNCKVQFAKCCTPIPGDEIIGYITNSNGVSIHTKTCKNILRQENKSRTIAVSWVKENITSFTAKIIVKLKINIESMNTKITTDKENIMGFSLSISDVSELQKIIKEIKKIDSVFEVKRVR